MRPCTDYLLELMVNASLNGSFYCRLCVSSGVHRNFVREWGGVQQIQLRTEDRENEGGSPLVSGSGRSFNLVQEISFNIVKFS